MQRKASPRLVRLKAKLGDDWFRARLLVVEAVQKDRPTADQIEKIRDCVKIAGELQRSFLPSRERFFPIPALHAGGGCGKEGEYRASSGTTLRARARSCGRSAGDADAQPERATQANSAPGGDSGCPGPAGDHQGVEYFRRAAREILRCAIAWTRNGLPRGPISAASAPRNAARK